MRICSGAGCLRAVADDVRFCDDCKPTAAPSSDGIASHTLTDRQRYHFLYSGRRWQRVREQAIKQHPMCDRCNIAVTAILDHMVPAGVVIVQAQESGRYPTDKYAGFYLMSNLQGLCRECHWVKTNEDKTHTGPWPDAIAVDTSRARRTWTF